MEMRSSGAYIAWTLLFRIAVAACVLPTGCSDGESNEPEAAQVRPKGADDYLKDLKSDSPDLRKKAAAVLWRLEVPLDDKIWQTVSKGLRTASEKDVDASVREDAKQALECITARWRIHILLNHPDHEHRAAAAWDLGFGYRFSHEPQEAECIEMIITALTKALSDKHPFVRGRTAEALKEFGPKAKKAVPALICSLRDPDTWVRNRTGYTLGAIKDPRAVNALIANLDDKEPTARSAAADGLGLIGGKEARIALPKLQAALRDPDEDVRAAAEEAIYLIRETSGERPEGR